MQIVHAAARDEEAQPAEGDDHREHPADFADLRPCRLDAECPQNAKEHRETADDVDARWSAELGVALRAARPLFDSRRHHIIGGLCSPRTLQTPAAAILLVGGLLACFAGYRIFRVVLGIYGFILGALLATSIVGTEHTMWTILAALGGGLAGALVLIARLFHRRGADRRRARRGAGESDLGRHRR